MSERIDTRAVLADCLPPNPANYKSDFLCMTKALLQLETVRAALAQEIADCARLREELDAQYGWFERCASRALDTTEPGRKFLARLKMAEDEVARLRAELAEAHGELAGHALMDVEGEAFLPEVVTQLQARVEALEKEAATLHAALMVFEAGWSTGGYLDPLDFWDKCFPRLNDLVPPEHRSFVWAVEQEMRDRAPLRGK